MVTRFSATEARTTSELAIKENELSKRIEVELKKKKAKESAEFKASWEAQRKQLIMAAINAKDTLYVEKYVCGFSKLMTLEFFVSEFDARKSKPNDSLNNFKSKNGVTVKEKREEVLALFDEFVDATQNEMKEYFGGLAEYYKEQYKILCDAWDYGYNFTCAYSSSMPDGIDDKYRHFYDDINKKIIEYKEYKECKELNPDDSDVDENEDSDENEYLFDADEVADDYMYPSAKKRALKIEWIDHESEDFFNNEIFSNKGLAWLSKSNGQSLLNAIFDGLKRASQSGKTKHKIKFSYTNDGWYCLDGSKKIHSCLPDELIEFLEWEGFTLDETISNESSYEIHLSW